MTRVSTSSPPGSAAITELRRSLRLARATASAALVASAASFALHCQSAHATQHPHNGQPPEILRARGLVIEDEAGVERVVIGAPTPDPRSGRRAAPLYGLVLNAADGSERGGYGVIDADDSTILTLDDAGGQEIFKVVGNTRAGATAWLMHHEGATIGLTTYRGRPELHLLERDGSTVAKLPADAPELD